MNKYFGKCHICGKETELTFEHIPPEKAANDMGQTLIESNYLNERLPWELEGLHYKNMQRGMGGYTLCSDCNNKTGAWYGNEYIKFNNFIGRYLTSESNYKKYNSLSIEFENLRPLNIVKQMLSMFASINSDKYFEINSDLREFILDRTSNKFDSSKYRIYLYLLKEYTNSNMGLCGMLISEDSGLVLRTLSNLNIYPLGIILEHIDEKNKDKPIKKLTDITNWTTDFEYDKEYKYELELNILEKNTIFPLDFSSKEEIIKRKNRKGDK